jgi:acetone carboxylase, alpha subunit
MSSIAPESATAEGTGIGYRGSSLADMAKQNTALWEETGCYHGLTNLVLKHKDPAKYEIFHSRLLSAVINVREAIRRISASPLVREESEQCFAIFTPEGDAIVYSTGIQIHVECMGRAVKYLVENGWEEMLGIAEGDVFETNDCARMGGVHGADVYDISPIFWEGELIAWVSSVVHEADIGGINAGGSSFMAADRFTDGHHVCGEKIAENDVLRADYPLRIRGNARVPETWILDTKAKIAGNIMIREEFKQIIESFGVDYVRQAAREIIEDERLAQLQRVKTQLVPGRYRSADVQDFLFGRLPMLPFAKKDILHNATLEVHVTGDGRMKLSTAGAQAWGYHGLNATVSGMEGGLNLALSQCLTYDGKANHGAFLACELDLAEGSIFNPGDTDVGTGLAFTSFLGLYGQLLNLVGRSRFSRGFREEILVSGQGSSIFSWGGRNQYGQSFGFPAIEATSAGGSGARGVLDGHDVGYAVWQMDASLGNVEFHELIFPGIWLGRTVLPDSAGYGKYRGGLSLQSTYLIHGSDEAIVQIMPEPSHITTYGNTGLFGGYPGSPDLNYLVENTNFQQLVEERKPLPHGEGADPADPDIKRLVEGDHSTVYEYFYSDHLKEGDIFQKLYFQSNGGYGDPIERDPELVRKDLDDGYTFTFTVENVNGVEASYDEASESWTVDEAKTEVRREAMRAARMERATSFKEWYLEQRKRVLEKDLDPLLMDMLRQGFELSPEYGAEYRRFWVLPDDFAF